MIVASTAFNWEKYFQRSHNPKELIESLGLAGHTPNSLDDAKFNFLFNIIPPEERLGFLLEPEVQASLEDHDFWKQFRNAWEMANNHQSLSDIIPQLLTDERATAPVRFSCMTDEERATFDLLPEKIRVYRGCWSRNVNGWSYTVDKVIAVWFANRLSKYAIPLLMTGWVNKADVILYLAGRNESELIINPAKVLKRRKNRLKGAE